MIELSMYVGRMRSSARRIEADGGVRGEVGERRRLKWWLGKWVSLLGHF